MRKFELVLNQSENTKLTITKDRITLETNEKSEDVPELKAFALGIAERTPPETNSLRGQIRLTDRGYLNVCLRFDSNEIYETFWYRET